MRNRHTPVPIQQAGNSTQQLSALAADLFIVITVRRCWPIACLWQQKQLLELAEVFCYSRLGVQGPLVQVYGDVLPTSAFLILVPRTKVVPHIFVAASEFIHDCQKLWALSVQMQLGRYAVLDSTGGPYTVFQCWPSCQFPEMHRAIYRTALLQILSFPYSVSGPTAGLILPHGAASTCLRGQSQCSFLLGYLPKMQACLPLSQTLQHRLQPKQWL